MESTSSNFRNEIASIVINSQNPDNMFSNFKESEKTSDATFNNLSINIAIQGESDQNENSELLYIKHEIIKMKDFILESRATLDVFRFIKNAVVLLNVTETNTGAIVEKLLEKMLSDQEIKDISKVKSAFFLNHPDQVLAETIQGINKDIGCLYSDQSWVCSMCNLHIAKKHAVGIARLNQPVNFGTSIQEVQFIILIISPMNQKETKNAFETAKTFATILAHNHFRQELLITTREDEFVQLILKFSNELCAELPDRHKMLMNSVSNGNKKKDSESYKCGFARGLRDDICRRLPYYVSDYIDGIRGHKTPQKVLATTFFLYFACLLPAIAFGVLNDRNTNHVIGVKKVIFAQAVGGVFFAIFSGQPLIILITTAPIALYIKTIHNISEDFNIDFRAMYSCVGLWNAFFIMLYSVFDASYIMKWCSRSSEEVFALFITIAFSLDAFSQVDEDFKKNYYSLGCSLNNTSSNSSTQTDIVEETSHHCSRENSLLCLLLMFGTLWLGLYLYNFNRSPFLNAWKREIISDYALTVSVILFSFIGSYVFKEIKAETFYYSNESFLQIAPFSTLTIGAIFGSMGLGLLMSFLFFMDQNISSAMVNNPSNKLKKGTAYHLDLLVMAIINAFLSVFGLPWVHAAIPHSPLHARALADTQVIVVEGHVQESIVYIRETRLTAIFSHIMIGLSILLIPYPLAYIPSAVLSGLFLYVAISGLKGNEFFERILLLITEQSAYPPNHYIRRVPQRKIHIYTACQIVQLGVLCIFGFLPFAYVQMIFPLILLFLLLARHKIVPKFIENKHIHALDSH